MRLNKINLHSSSNKGEGASEVSIQQSDCAQFRSDKDVHHDSYLIPRSLALKDLAEDIFQLTESLRSVPSRKSRASATENRRKVVINLITNLAALFETSNDGGVLVVATGQKTKSRYDRSDFAQYLLKDTITLLVDLGLIHRTEHVFKKFATTITPTDKLWEAFSNLGSGSHVSRLDGDEVIVLKAYINRRWSKPLVDYTETDETIKLRGEMNIINRSLSTAKIEMNSREVGSNFLKRYFQIYGLDSPEKFNSHGRLYGGFWQNLKKNDRGSIRLNGEGVCDLDYSSMFATLAYWKVGKKPPSEDLYGCVQGLDRADAKTVLLSLLSRTGPMLKVPEALTERLKPRGWTGKKLQASMEAAHPEIAPLFCRNVAIELMYIESKILVNCLVALVQRSVTALPMHDGIMVSKSHRELATTQMLVSAHDVLGRNDIVRVVEKPIEDRG